jgi:hypothetical protein
LSFPVANGERFNANFKIGGIAWPFVLAGADFLCLFPEFPGCYDFKKYFRQKIWQKYWRFLLKPQLVFD